MTTTILETMGRARLEVRGETYSIIVVRNLNDDFNAIPRPVRHIGQRKHIMPIWNQMKNKRSQYESDAKNMFQSVYFR